VSFWVHEGATPLLGCAGTALLLVLAGVRYWKGVVIFPPRAHSPLFSRLCGAMQILPARFSICWFCVFCLWFSLFWFLLFCMFLFSVQLCVVVSYFVGTCRILCVVWNMVNVFVLSVRGSVFDFGFLGAYSYFAVYSRVGMPSCRMFGWYSVVSLGYWSVFCGHGSQPLTWLVLCVLLNGRRYFLVSCNCRLDPFFDGRLLYCCHWCRLCPCLVFCGVVCRSGHGIYLPGWLLCSWFDGVSSKVAWFGL